MVFNILTPKRTVLTILTTALLVTGFANRNNPAPQLTATDGGDSVRKLRVALDIDMPGYFSIESEDFGYQYDLLTAFADHAGMELEILPGKTQSEITLMLASGEADLAATLEGHAAADAFARTVYSTSFSMIARRADAAQVRREAVTDPRQILDGRSVMISSSFKLTPSWDMLLDSVSTSGTYVSSRNAVDLVDGLRAGEYDLLICEKSEAQLIIALNTGLGRVADFDDPVGISVAAASAGMAEEFDGWYSAFNESEQHAALASIYLDRGTDKRFAHRSRKGRAGKGISEYDMVMREVCEREGYDWRLLSAIAYNESRFNADIVSHRGARGLMQIMPQTARQFNVSPDDSMEPEVNIMLAAKLLGKIEGMLRFGGNISYNDRLSIILACYNCGVGHVFDARRLAVKYGANPDSWKDVSYFLQRKGEPEFLADDAVKCGRFNGSGQTLAFVDGVINRYNSYCAMVSR